MAPRILIVEDHELFAHTLAEALKRQGFDANVIVPHSGGDVLEAAGDVQPTIVLLDMHLGFDIGTGLGLIGPLKQQGRKVVVLTADDDPVRTARAVKAGAVGVIHKSRPFEELVAAVAHTAAGRSLLSPLERQEIISAADNGSQEQIDLGAFSRLTPREQEVLACLAEGKTAQTIAEEAVVSIATVRAQIASVRTKLGAPTQLAAASMALRAGWTPTARTSPARPAVRS